MTALIEEQGTNVKAERVRIVGAVSMPARAARAGRAAFIVLAVVTASLLSLAPAAFAQAPGTARNGSNPQLLTKSPPEDALGPVDWVLVVDTSASMSGREQGALNIFPAVQETLRRFVPEIREDDTLTIIVFDEASRIVSTVPKRLRSLLDRETVVRLIDGLSARGPWTHTGVALTDALKEVYSRSDGGRPAAIIMLTDGHEDVRGIKNPVTIPDAIRIIRDQDVPYVFYVSLGTEPDPKVMEFLGEINKKSAGHGRAFNDPGASRLFDNAREIRRLMSVTRIRPLQLKPAQLDVGRVRPGGSAKAPPVEVLSPVPATLRLRLLEVPAGLRVTGVPGTLACGPGQWGQVRMEITAASDDAGGGGQTFKLEVEPDGLIKGLDPAAQVIQVKLDVRETAFETVAEWVLRHWWWLLLMILLILLIVYLLRQWYIYGDTPLELIRRWLARWQPRPPAMLRTPDGEIRLQDSVTLGGGAGVLSRSPATVAMHRVGNDYFLIVEKGAVTVVDPSGLLKHAMKSGDEKMKLKHKSQIIMPGYSSPLLYLNSAVLRRS